ncbi:hypothetical protein H310_13001 [Aphanomyces invadans]|uniref:PLOD1-3-like GT domain-containing protein n=1 Tax=Aphanomyces invadans TaxID=157072 RepID=A0A024TFI3_9STRA|nr:hypothetical protein H310_13001 [Aphanomyces invadans]ETV92774.1 hypothetical protein H310_13001 [Aphanomyces invadans]|eukprot:XP_008878544.1 hypothetical protein H310_13001 [Aphanomyces invadans]
MPPLVPKKYQWPLLTLLVTGALLGATDVLTYRKMNVLMHATGARPNAAVASLRATTVTSIPPHPTASIAMQELETTRPVSDDELVTPSPSESVSIPLAAESNTPARFVPRQLRVLTLADNPRPEICLTATSVFQAGMVLQVLAWDHSTEFFDHTSCGDPCKPNAEGDFRVGQQKKVHWLSHFFEHNTDLHDDDLILFTDAWDVVIQRDLREITNVFLAQTNHDRGVVFNGEPGCGDSFTLPGMYGDQLRHGSFAVQLESTYPARMIQGDNMCNMIAAKTSMNSLSKGPNWSLGSGGMLGDVRSVRAFLRRVNQVHAEQLDKYSRHESPFFFYGDQIAFQLAYVRFPEINVKVDTSGDIFFVTSFFVTPGDLDHFSLHGGCDDAYFAHNTPSKLAWHGGTPFFLHFPGGYKHLYATCAPQVEHAVRDQAPGKYMFDVDRQKNVLVSSVCPNYS